MSRSRRSSWATPSSIASRRYHRTRHTAIGETPLARFRAGPDVLRPSPAPEILRTAFTTEQRWAQRRSDGTLTVAGVAPLLQALLDQYRASGLPPSYQPKDEPGPEEDDR